MGMRHQIYIKLPARLSKDHPQHLPQRFIALHHQNLWGYRAVSCLNQFLTFWKNDLEREDNPEISGYIRDWHSEEIAMAMWSVDINNGWFGSVALLEPPHDPILGHKSDGTGVTIVDLTMLAEKRLRYAFMFVHLSTTRRLFESFSATQFLEIVDKKNVDLGEKFIDFELIPTDQVLSWFPKTAKHAEAYRQRSGKWH